MKEDRSLQIKSRSLQIKSSSRGKSQVPIANFRFFSMPNTQIIPAMTVP